MGNGGLVLKAWQATSNVRNAGFQANDGSPATSNEPVPGTFGSSVNWVNPGTNVRGAQVLPPSPEKAKPQPSLKSKSFQAPASSVPVPSMPSDSSLSANRSWVTLTGLVTETVPAAAVCGKPSKARADTTVTTENLTRGDVRSRIDPPQMVRRRKKPMPDTALPLR